MPNILSSHLLSLARMVYPDLCLACNHEVHRGKRFICLYCEQDLPLTKSWTQKNHFLEKQFWGRIPLLQADAFLYFEQGRVTQQILKKIKYRGDQELAVYMGRIFAERLLAPSSRFIKPDVIIPLPLHRKKERIRGFNQSELIARGMSEVLDVELNTSSIIRTVNNITQTGKNKWQRWQNVESVFKNLNPSFLEGKHVLLLDDVITTGSTLESCGVEILKSANTSLSIASIATASKLL